MRLLRIGIVLAWNRVGWRFVLSGNGELAFRRTRVDRWLAFLLRRRAWNAGRGAQSACRGAGPSGDEALGDGASWTTC